MEKLDYLAEERKKAEFDVEEMKIVWAGSRHAFKVSDRISKLIANGPAFGKENRTMLAWKELFKNTLRKAAYAWKLINELRLSEEEASKLRFFEDEPAFTDLHWGIFIPAIKGQGTEEQQKQWLPLAYKMQIIGCYAQTKLGHGSNVQGLETTATFDPQTDEFVIHSPTLMSSKSQVPLLPDLVNQYCIEGHLDDCSLETIALAENQQPLHTPSHLQILVST